jgi:undecaprenyl-diphosphatase
VARQARRELEPLACPVPAHRPRGERDLLVTGAALAASLTGLALLTRVARRPLPSRLDVATTRLLQRRHSQRVTRAMVLISAPGFAPLQHALTVGTALDLWAFGHRREALFTMLTMGAGSITGVIKIAVGRPRPDPTYMRAIFQFRDKSFPSGHCTHYAAFYGYLFYLTRRCMRPSPLRTLILTTCATLVLLVAPSRVYLGHHWTSDTLAGDLVGLTYLFALIEAYETLGVHEGLHR